MVHLDGSYGEGGGQIVRTSLSLAALLQVPVSIENIRAGRPKPGLRAQHLTAVRALAAVTRAEMAGAELNSGSLVFKPGRPRPGHYLFDVAETTSSAGAVALVAQAVLPALLFAPGGSTVIIRGGTHVPWSPPAHYLSQVFLPLLRRLGAAVTLTLEQWGFYPRGGGQVRLEISPARTLAPLAPANPPPRKAFRGLSAAGRLPEHVIRRQAARLKERLGQDLPVEEVAVDSRDPGSFVFLWAPGAGFSALGARGKPAERVADEVADAYLNYEARGAALDRHLADQILLYLALARGASRFTTEAVTRHLFTNIWVIEQFYGPLFQVAGALGEPGKVACQGKG
jgi:RNA 3'-phosphate cyclase